MTYKVNDVWVGRYGNPASSFLGGGCLCIEDDFEGFGPSLCEEQSVSEAGIESGMRVILRPGHAPLTNEVMLGL